MMRLTHIAYVLGRFTGLLTSAACNATSSTNTWSSHESKSISSCSSLSLNCASTPVCKALSVASTILNTALRTSTRPAVGNGARMSMPGLSMVWNAIAQCMFSSGLRSLYLQACHCSMSRCLRGWRELARTYRKANSCDVTMRNGLLTPK
jgi:hypothetical protein